MKNTIKSLLVIAGSLALVNGASAATLAGTTQKIGSTVAGAGSSVVGGAASLGKGILRAPGNILSGLSDGQGPNLSKGRKEIGISGNIDFSSDIVYNLNLTYGHFIKDNWQVGFVASVIGEDSDANFGLGLFTEYNWVRQSNWVPFVGASIEAIGSDSNTTGGIALDFGVKYFINSNVAVTFLIKFVNFKSGSLVWLPLFLWL